ncbi:RNA polymerase Rpb6 [Acanthamoeba polyphaga moumouvirus]|uniref:RNA polymerase Rpb6 n=1 Tax=Acanthamoeba polyphaga moumouvirus TaxID=1269028 RepID=L7RCN7_9VIRU|nr:RNA polymerase Rpb6 [Acanthamoeba polyphaga moumouvirus]AGC01778.1 RNA polymerase Rpb6 [Acanthamoeba polyphaga moumouvirus]AQN68127.1 RNA polymerase rpb6 [Saudi moumouvirus]
MPKKFNSKSKKNTKYSYDDEGEFRNSEDEYVSGGSDVESENNSDVESGNNSDVESENNSDVESEIESEASYHSNNNSDDESYQSGGVSDAADDQLDDDSATLDVDPDDEVDIDVDGDEKYDPIQEIDEPVDDDQGSELDEHGIDEVDPDSVDATEFANENNKKCHLKNLAKDKDYIALDDDDSNLYGKMEFKRIPDEERETDPIMTYYEMVRILGTRAQQFNYGAKPLVQGVNDLHPAKMAYVELIAKMTPFIIRRNLPGKKYEDWKINELEIIHQISEDFFVPGKFNWKSFQDQNPNANVSSRIIQDYTASLNVPQNKSFSSKTKRSKTRISKKK